MKTILDLHNEEQAESAKHDMARRWLWVGLEEVVRLRTRHRAIQGLHRCIMVWFIVGLTAATVFWLVVI